MLVVLSLGFLIRFHDISGASLWLDEILQLNTTRGPFSEIWSDSSNNKPPLDYYIQWLFVRGGFSETSARLHACIFGVLTILAIGFWGKEMGGRRLAMIAMMLVMVSPVLVKFSREGRPYSLMIFSQCLFYGFYWRILRKQNYVKTRDWIGLSVAALLCFWSLYWGGGIVLFCMIFAIMVIHLRRKNSEWHPFTDKKRIHVPLICLLVVILAVIPLYLRSSSTLTREHFAEYNVFNIRHYTLYLDIFACGYDWWQLVKGAWIPFTLISLAGFFGWFFRKDKRIAAVFCFVSFIVFFFGMFLFYRFINHWMEMRYTLAAFPSGIMLFAMGIDTVSRPVARLFKTWKMRNRRKVDIVAFVITLIPVCLFTFYLLVDPLKRNDWRGAMSYINERVEPGAIIITDRYTDFQCVIFYADIMNLDASICYNENNENFHDECILKYDNIWFIAKKRKITPEYLYVMNGDHFFGDFHGICLAGRIPAAKMKELRPELVTNSLNADNAEIEVDISKPENPFLGIGWSIPEKWGEETVRSMNGPLGEIFFYTKSPSDMVMDVTLFPYAYETTPSLTIDFAVNNHPVKTVDPINWWNEVSLEIPGEYLKSGVNLIEIIPSRLVRPVEIDSESEDLRRLSIWIRKISISLREN